MLLTCLPDDWSGLGSDHQDSEGADLYRERKEKLKSSNLSSSLWICRDPQWIQSTVGHRDLLLLGKKVTNDALRC